MSATVPREMTAKITLMISFILLHSCSQPNTEASPGFIKLTMQCKAHRQPEHCWPRGFCCVCTVLLRCKWGHLAENILHWSHASNTLLSRDTTSTTTENMKEPLKTAKQSHSLFPANKIPVGISVKLPFGAVSQNSLLYIIMSFGFITKGRRLRYLQCWSRSASSSQLCICDLGKVIQLSNG